MQKIVSIKCPKCNNNHSFYRYGKDKYGHQKYLCRNCNHQFAPDSPVSKQMQNYPRCPVCGKATFLHHDYDYYSNFRCCDKKCNHSLFVSKPNSILPASMSKLIGKTDFKRMRYPLHVIITALSMFYLGKNSFRNIALILRVVNNIKVSHTTISNWCKKFAPLFNNLALELMPMMNFNSDEWHADETVEQAFTIFNSVKNLGTVNSIVSDRYSAYKMPIKSVLGENVKHIRVESFKDDISNNLIESFHHQFKAWYKTKQGFNSYDSTNNLISMFVFFYNFVRPHSALSGLTPAQVAGLSLTDKEKKKYLLIA